METRKQGRDVQLENKEMLLQFLPMQCPGLSLEGDKESHISGMDFLEMIFVFNRQHDDSSNDDDTSNPARQRIYGPRTMRHSYEHFKTFFEEFSHLDQKITIDA
ncbi:hypothetical protein Droror1_Dr00022078 [Drosera rotundifolia]